MTWLVSCACVFLRSVFWLFSRILTCCWLRAMDLFYHVFVVAWIVHSRLVWVMDCVAWIVGLICCLVYVIWIVYPGFLAAMLLHALWYVAWCASWIVICCLVYVMDCLSWFLGCQVVTWIVICRLVCVCHGLRIMFSRSLCYVLLHWSDLLLGVGHGLVFMFSCCVVAWIVMLFDWFVSWIVHLSCFAWILWRLLWHMDCVWHFRCCVCCRDCERFAWCLAWVVYQVYHDFLGVLLHGLWFDSLM